MSEAQAKQERMAAVVMSLGSIFIAAMEFLDRPEAGELVEADPDWYVIFNLVLHAAILVLLLFALVRLPRSTADRPDLRVPFTVMVLVGIVAAAYVVGRDLGLV
jgi:surface polysaccharide O-acyltransferase-like enzyme